MSEFDPYKELEFKRRVKELAKQYAPIMGMIEEHVIEGLYAMARNYEQRRVLFGEDGKSKEKPIGAVTGMYKREWSEPNE